MNCLFLSSVAFSMKLHQGVRRNIQCYYNKFDVIIYIAKGLGSLNFQDIRLRFKYPRTNGWLNWTDLFMYDNSHKLCNILNVKG